MGGVGLRGPGETQLEVDRREISRKISYLKEELEKIRAHRGRYRAQRKRTAVPTVAIVGYTNAGKSTLLNTLTNAGVLAADQLFATLDPTTRRVELPGGKSVLFTDTVGFIQKLPTTLVAAFRATLEEIAEADLLLHVVDVTHPNALEQAKSVKQTLEELEVAHIPVVTALNKIDRLGGIESVSPALAAYPNVVAISALKRQGFEALLERIQAVLQQSLLPIDASVPYAEGQLISIFHEQGVVESVNHEEKGVRLRGRVPARLFERFKPYLIKARRRKA